MISLRKIFARKNINFLLLKSLQSPVIAFQASNMKFHQLGQNPDLEEHIHMIPEDNILSKFILDDKPKKYQP